MRLPLPAAMPFWLLPLIVVLFSLNMGGYLLFDHDEGAFSEATRGMFERGDFITTWLNDRVRFDKPILIYWLQGVSMSLFGTEVWAFRLPSVLAGIIWSMATFVFARHYLSRDTGVAAAMICASALGINVISHVATADALLNSVLACTLLLMYHHSRLSLRDPRAGKGVLYTVYALMGIGVLTKGPVAVAIPGAVAVIFYLWNGQREALLRALFFVPGWVLFLAIAAPWYVLEYMAQGQDFINGFFLKHNVNRFNNAMEGHGGSLFFYPLVLPFVLAPFGPLLLRMLPSIKSVTSDPLNRFLWIWFLFVLVLFSAASTKLPHYILYGCTPLVLLMARHRFALKRRWLVAILPALFFALFAIFPLLVPTIKAGLTNPIEIATAERASHYINTAFAIKAAVLGLIAVGFILWRKLAIWKGLFLAGICQAIFTWYVFAPAFSEAQQRPIYNAAMFAREHNLPVTTLSIDTPSFNVYLDKVTPRRSDLPAGRVGFGREDRIDNLSQYDVLFHEGPIVLIQWPDSPAMNPTDADQTHPTGAPDAH